MEALTGGSLAAGLSLLAAGGRMTRTERSLQILAAGRIAGNVKSRPLNDRLTVFRVIRVLLVIPLTGWTVSLDRLLQKIPRSPLDTIRQWPYNRSLYDI